jgi:2'-5' RNA ligase
MVDERGRTYDAARLKVGDQVDNIGWIRDDNLHLTVKFFGEVVDQQVPSLCDAISTARLGPRFKLRPSRIIHFPPRGKINSIAVNLTGDLDSVALMLKELEKAVEPLGFPAERRRFTPHVTIGRAKGIVNHIDLRQLSDPAEPESGPEFVVDRLALMHSDLRPGGPVYTKIAEFPLLGQRCGQST